MRAFKLHAFPPRLTLKALLVWLALGTPVVVLLDDVVVELVFEIVGVVAVDVVVELEEPLVVVAVVVETPPVIVEPVMGMGVVIRVDEPGGGKLAAPPFAILAIANDGLVLPESPNTMNMEVSVSTNGYALVTKGTHRQSSSHHEVVHPVR